MYDVAIIGGGLAGLVNAVHLSKAGVKVLVLERNTYPKHKVCGEYVSKEVLPYLESIGIHPFQMGATSIDKFV
ncbi:MAG: FAD-dependent oxidoreductase, partial [Bacteroidota bacterium]